MWTYSWDQLDQPLYQVRLIIGDIVACDQQLQDEEILYFIGSRGSNYGAAAECCRSLATRMARSFDQQAAGSKVFYSQMYKQYTQKAIEYETLATMIGSGVPYAGGISLTDMNRERDDPDRPPPQFFIGMHTNLIPVPPVGAGVEGEASGVPSVP